jgi:hypothetical protein
MTIEQALRQGWAVKVWPHYKGYTAVFVKAGEVERNGRGPTFKKAVKKAFR